MITEEKIIDPDIVYHCPACGYQFDTAASKLNLRNTGKCPGCEARKRDIMRVIPIIRI